MATACVPSKGIFYLLFCKVWGSLTRLSFLGQEPCLVSCVSAPLAQVCVIRALEGGVRGGGTEGGPKLRVPEPYTRVSFLCYMCAVGELTQLSGTGTPE